MNIPVVLIIYHRPDLSRNLINYLRPVKPSNIYVVADGPKDAPDNASCETTRRVIKEIDWPCTVHKVYAKTNMGLHHRVVSGLNHVFKREKWAIILEDDLVIDPSFFRFCEQLLKKYENNDKIISISGNNFQFGKNKIKESYYFSRYVHSWGWATWKRAWDKYDDKLTDWDKLRHSNWLHSLLSSNILALYWGKIFDMVSEGQVDSWAYRWTYSSFRNNKLTIIPDRNLVSNLGYGAQATHTTRKSRVMGMETSKMIFPLKHPNKIQRNKNADHQTDVVVYLNPIIIISLLVKSIVRLPRCKKN